MKMTNKQTLTALAKCCAQKDVRYYLNGVHMGAEKMTTTNGHIMMQATYLQHDTDDFPFNDGVPVCEGTDDKIVPITAVNAAIRNATKDGLPILDQTIVISSPSSKAVSLVSTDLEVEKVTNSKTVDGTYPDVEAVMQADSGKEVHFVGVNPEYLIALGQACKAVGATGVKLMITDKDGAVRFEAHDPHTNVDLAGVIMPMRL